MPKFERCEILKKWCGLRKFETRVAINNLISETKVPVLWVQNFQNVKMLPNGENAWEKYIRARTHTNWQAFVSKSILTYRSSKWNEHCLKNCWEKLFFGVHPSQNLPILPVQNHDKSYLGRSWQMGVEYLKICPLKPPIACISDPKSYQYK